MTAPLVWALKLVINHTLEWFYVKLKMSWKLAALKKERRRVTRGIVKAIKLADTEQQRRDALDGAVRGGFG